MPTALHAVVTIPNDRSRASNIASFLVLVLLVFRASIPSQKLWSNDFRFLRIFFRVFYLLLGFFCPLPSYSIPGVFSMPILKTEQKLQCLNDILGF